MRDVEQLAMAAEAKVGFLLEQQEASSRRGDAKVVEKLARQRRSLEKEMRHHAADGHQQDQEQRTAEQKLKSQL